MRGAIPLGPALEMRTGLLAAPVGGQNGISALAAAVRRARIMKITICGESDDESDR
jgi:hypothetical protein